MIAFHVMSSPEKSEPQAWDDYYAAAIRSGSGRAHAVELADQGLAARRERYPVIADTEPPSASTQLPLPLPPPSGRSVLMCLECEDSALAGEVFCEAHYPEGG